MSRVGLDQVFGYGIKFDHPVLGNLFESHLWAGWQGGACPYDG